MPRAISTRNPAGEQGIAWLGDPISSSCESRFPLLRNARVAGVQFLVPVIGQGVPAAMRSRARLCTTAFLPGRPTSAGSASRHSLNEMDGLDGLPLIGRTARACACARDGR